MPIDPEEKKRRRTNDLFTVALDHTNKLFRRLESAKKNQGNPNIKGVDQGRTLKKKKNLKNALDVHWRTDADGYESIMRQVFDESGGRDTLSDAERKRWFKRGWQKRLIARRIKHRREGILDAIFLHPSLKAK